MKEQIVDIVKAITPTKQYDEDVAAVRRQYDVIGALLGAATGYGLARWRHKGNMPKILALTAMGAGVGTAGAEVLGQIYHPMKSEITSPVSVRKNASQMMIENLAIPDSKKQLLSISRRHAVNKSVNLINDKKTESYLKQMELAKKQSNPYNG